MTAVGVLGWFIPPLWSAGLTVWLERRRTRARGMEAAAPEGGAAEGPEGDIMLAGVVVQRHDEDPVIHPHPQTSLELKAHEALVRAPSTSTSVSQGGSANGVGYPKANRGQHSSMSSTASDRTTTAVPVVVLRAEEASEAPAGNDLAVGSDAGALA